ncbi:unnamed protein product [Cuscuta europaea]|uniref:Late embryogenesis abundant protein LEA-2 subgroup domain-containing protein n=1 Tax=Cuscuta europaea TaxID=41803 RepID=A0A9P1EKT9_CUSEU|nr:unnamed protein product [Cuscuta europaea]
MHPAAKSLLCKALLGYTVYICFCALIIVYVVVLKPTNAVPKLPRITVVAAEVMENYTLTGDNHFTGSFNFTVEQYNPTSDIKGIILSWRSTNASLIFGGAVPAAQAQLASTAIFDLFTPPQSAFNHSLDLHAEGVVLDASTSAALKPAAPGVTAKPVPAVLDIQTDIWLDEGMDSGMLQATCKLFYSSEGFAMKDRRKCAVVCHDCCWYNSYLGEQKCKKVTK